MSRRGAGLAAAVALATLTACAAGASGAPTTSPHRTASPVHPPTATPTDGAAVRRGASAVGALFPEGVAHPHDCTATVVASASGDVVMTAAHCVSGTAAGTVFVPGYDAGATPFGTWTVTGAFAPDGWLSDQDADDDVAFLTVAPHGSTTLQQVTGAVTVGAAPVDGETVSITAYNLGLLDQPVHCATKVRDTVQRPTIDCGGFLGGSSGSAWLASRDGTVTAVGLIGGLHQGGCTAATSYSPPFDATEAALLTRAGGAGPVSETLPTPPDDGC